MSRLQRLFLLVVVAVLGFVLSAPLWLTSGETARRRLVVVVVIDTLRADEFELASRSGSFAGALRHRSTVYRRAYSSSGWTLPAVASILTGVDPEVHHAHGKATVLAPLSPDLTTLAEAFRAANFRTVAVTNAAFLSPLLGLDRGFDVYDHEHAYNRSVRRADATVMRALEYVRAAEGRDLFLFVHLFDPHVDYDPVDVNSLSSDGPPPTLQPPITLQHLRELEESGDPDPRLLEDVRTWYRAEARFAIDAAVFLHEQLIHEDWARTMRFALTSDHGEEFHEHGGFEHGHTLHSELVHVPLVIDYRFGSVPDGKFMDGVVSTRDLGRHLLESLCLDVPETFAPSTSDWNGTGGGVAYSATTLYGPDRIALRTDDHALHLELNVDSQSIGVQYDLEADPREQHPLDPDAELVRRLLDRRRVNRELGRTTRRLDWQDLGPSKHAERNQVLESLESLGYTGSDD